ncbi:MAG: oligosaccharide repeat unit polymerase [Burkholderiales bacterium]|nr:oligosaccharide repeat unit polymerase [Burkholderiales bacterium]
MPTGYGIKAFDEYIIRLAGVDGGSNVFLLIHKLLGRGRSGESIDIEAGEFNVFSYIQAPYMDFGVMGVVLITYLFGLIWGAVFNCIRFSAFAVLMYASMIYPAIVVFYACSFPDYLYLFIHCLPCYLWF